MENQKFKLREIYGAKKLQSHLSTAFLNVDGLSDAKLADVVSYAEQCSPDIIFLLETKRRMLVLTSTLKAMTSLRSGDLTLLGISKVGESLATPKIQGT